MRVKICGITNLPDAEAAVLAGADALGFILHETSQRFIPIEEAVAIVRALPPFVQTVAVTANAVKEFTNLGWRKQLKHFGAAQLHGEESPAHAKAVSKYLPVIKVFPADSHTLILSGVFEMPEHMRATMERLKAAQARLQSQLGRAPSRKEISHETHLPAERVESLLRMADRMPSRNSSPVAEYQAAACAFLLDTPSAEKGGSGRVFDWNLAVEFKKRTTKPLILSGGLTSENVAKAVETVHPYAVDVSSGVEASPGRKDHAKLRAFLQICKSF